METHYQRFSGPTLGRRFFQESQVIIDEWVTCVRKNIPAAEGKSDYLIQDHLQQFLENMAVALQNPDWESSELKNFRIGRQHGRQRAEMEDYNLDQIILEYHLLRTTIFDHFEEVLLSRHERNLINEYIDHAIRKAATEFEEIRRGAMKSRDEVLTMISHELRTPLTALLLQAQSFQRAVRKNNGDLTARTSSFAELVNQQVLKLNRLVDDMLDIARIRAGKFTLHKENFSLSELVDDVVNRITPEQVRTPQLNLAINDEGYWDRLRIEQVLMNLLSNAMKYGEGKLIELSVSPEEDKVTLFVTDHGPGIDREKLSIIFNKFERAGVENEHASGLGLGLFISKRIIEAHGGTIIAESEPGEWTTFTITLPRFSREDA